MNNTFYTVEQISQMLNIHPKTIQRYIREGKLRATKIGKGWRVAGHDLSVFTECDFKLKDSSSDLSMKSGSSVSAFSVIDIIVDGKNDAIRIMNTMTAAINAKPSEYGRSSMQTEYIEAELKVRITLWGAVRFISVMLDTVTMLTENIEEE